MKQIIPDKKLFWFLKEGIPLNLSEPSILDMYVQQVISRGNTEDIKAFLRIIKPNEIKTVLMRIGHFIPAEVRGFWEDFLADNK